MKKRNWRKPKDSDWLRVTFDGEQYITRDWDLKFKLARKKIGNKRGDFFVSGNKVLFYEKHVVATWKHERFADKACTIRVKV